MVRIRARFLVSTVAALGVFTVLAGVASAEEQGVIKARLMTTDMAAKIAQASLAACREMGYQTAVVVVDRTAQEQVVMRDTLASRFTIDLARGKAYAVILSGVDSGALLASRQDIRMELNQVQGIKVMEGGLAIRAAGSLIGAVGVSGAPGGDLDAACAVKGLEAVQEQLDFAD